MSRTDEEMTCHFSNFSSGATLANSPKKSTSVCNLIVKFLWQCICTVSLCLDFIVEGKQYIKMCTVKFSGYLSRLKMTNGIRDKPRTLRVFPKEEFCCCFCPNSWVLEQLTNYFSNAKSVSKIGNSIPTRVLYNIFPDKTTLFYFQTSYQNSSMIYNLIANVKKRRTSVFFCSF